MSAFAKRKLKFRLGTRGSDLARAQSGDVAAALARAGVETEVEIISTAGDRSAASSFADIGPQGVFVREIEQALIEGRVDYAVHSLKDLPSKSPDGLVIGAVPKRTDAADVLLIRADAIDDTAEPWLPLKEHARVGTASMRRQAWLKHLRPDLDVRPLRGNVPTRIGRLGTGNSGKGQPGNDHSGESRDGEPAYDAIVLAAAGIERLGPSGVLAPLLETVTLVRLTPSRFVPAPAQGALAVQCRKDDERVLEVLAHIDEPADRETVMVEREALALAEGGCDLAFGAACTAGERGFALDLMLERDGIVRAAHVEDNATQGLARRGWDKLQRAFASQ